MSDEMIDPTPTSKPFTSLAEAANKILVAYRSIQENLYKDFYVGGPFTSPPAPPTPPTRYEHFTESVNEWASTVLFRVALLVLAIWRGAKYGIERARLRADELFFEE